MRTKFWMVYGFGTRGGPTFMHPTFDTALIEARKLASTHINVEFVVLEAVTAVKAGPPSIEEEPIVEWEDGGETPTLPPLPPVGPEYYERVER